ncbi:MAG TPA: hypothetical protein PLW88_02615 [Syntrophorhabdaceae bacterium]|nr:hypothetical protein [Syntrophorhabdaceae bacterium]HPP06235.1 hypothetical protein [Syntrophorhabdaceae bacterium]
MRRFVIVVLALFICLAISVPGIAQTKPGATEKATPKVEPTAPEKPAKPEAAKPEATKEAEKPKPKPVSGIVGIVESVDAGLLTIKSSKGILTFDISNAKFKGYKNAGDIKVGDKVSATSIKGVMTVTKIAGAKKAKK